VTTAANDGRDGRRTWRLVDERDAPLVAGPDAPLVVGVNCDEKTRRPACRRSTREYGSRVPCPQAEITAG
jgi:hypothetical protein